MGNNELLTAISSMLDEKIGCAIKLGLQPLYEKMEIIENRMDSLEHRMEAMENRMDPIENRINSIENRIDSIENRIDSIESQISDINERINSMGNQISDINDRIDSMNNQIILIDGKLTDTRLHIENVTDANIRLLAENYIPASERYMRTSNELAGMKSDIDNLKIVVAEHSEKLRYIS